MLFKRFSFVMHTLTGIIEVRMFLEQAILFRQFCFEPAVVLPACHRRYCALLCNQAFHPAHAAPCRVRLRRRWSERHPMSPWRLRNLCPQCPPVGRSTTIIITPESAHPKKCTILCTFLSNVTKGSLVNYGQNSTYIQNRSGVKPCRTPSSSLP